MPQISRFFGIIVQMYFDDHLPPHFHVRYGDFNAQINIRDLTLLSGQLPHRVLGLVVEWASLHKNELLENWDRALEHHELVNINPLE